MEINRNNYEPYFIDYIEGKLSTFEVERLMSFLLSNPDLAKELNKFDNSIIGFENSIFIQKDSLKRNINNVLKINENNFDEFCIANIEGDLNEKSKILFEQYIAIHPENKNIYNLYSNTFLKPDFSIVFPKKSTLKRKYFAKVKPLIYFISAAASISLIILIYKNFNHQVVNQKKEIAEFIIPVCEPVVRKNANLIILKTMILAQRTEYPSTKNISDTVHEKIPLMMRLRKSNEIASIPAYEYSLVQKENTINDIEKISSIYPVRIDNEFSLKEYATHKIIERVKDKLPIGNSIIALAKNGFNNLLTSTGVIFVDHSKNNRAVYSFNSRPLSLYSSKEK